ncbi:9929_t:CDS:2 [Funneliformis geosporum]|uniref:9929_t:CDS:1 n=1 Tax=Funneliformis geosporum TaxID=1117311 RepID=A0A9W4WWW1_9GLOM|nr:9929_t:CDS:2 [Funneliformis geosporum]
MCQLYELGKSDDLSLFTCERKDLKDDSPRIKITLCLFVPYCQDKSIRGFAKTVSTERKASEMEEGDTFTGKTFGIVTDAEKCYFLECSYNEGKLSFKLSEPVTVVYKDEDLQAKVEKVLKHIVCLFEDAQKLDSVLDVDKSREINQRVRLAGNLAGMGTSSTKSN